MINHVSIGARDIAATKRFYDAALGALGYKCLSVSPDLLGYGADTPVFWIYASERPVPADPASGLHFCFNAPTRDSVKHFQRRRSPAAARTMASQDCARTTARTTTPPL